MTLYSIKNWVELFEVSQNRHTKKWSWVAVPIKHDGKGYRRVAAMPNAASILGCWMLILQVAAKCPTRGVLSDDDGPLSAIDLSDKTGVPESAFSEALEVLSSERIGWITTARYSDATAQCSEPIARCNYRTVPDNTGQDSTGHNNTNTGRDSGACADVPKAWKKPSVFIGVTAGLLRDPVALNDWHSAAAQQQRPVISASDRDRLFVFAAAERALDRTCAKPADNPAALFAWLVANEYRTRPTEAHYEAARRRLKAFDEAARYGDRLPRAGPQDDLEAEIERKRASELKSLTEGAIR